MASKTLLLLRSEAIIQTLKLSYRPYLSKLNLLMIDVNTRIEIEKKVSLSETKDNFDILSQCGWKAKRQGL